MIIKNFRLRVLGVVCFSIAFIFSSPVFAKEWYEYYKEAEKAIEKEEWEVAIDLLEKAIKDDPEPGERKRMYGVRFMEYYPYLKLGEVYLETGDIEKARDYCEKAKEKGAAPKKEVKRCLEDANRKKGLAIGEDRPAAVPEETEPAEPLPLGETYAVIIGVGDYLDDRIPDLGLTVNDAQGLYDVLTDPEHGGDERPVQAGEFERGVGDQLEVAADANPERLARLS